MTYRPTVIAACLPTAPYSLVMFGCVNHPVYYKLSHGCKNLHISPSDVKHVKSFFIQVVSDIISTKQTPSIHTERWQQSFYCLFSLFVLSHICWQPPPPPPTDPNTFTAFNPVVQVRNLHLLNIPPPETTSTLLQTPLLLPRTLLPSSYLHPPLWARLPLPPPSSLSESRGCDGSAVSALTGITLWASQPGISDHAAVLVRLFLR